jgi:putative ABC transport system permease protein
MSWLSRISGLFRARRLDADLDQELRSHVDMRTEANIASGMSPEAARLDAMRRFGNYTLITEDTRHAGTVLWAENVVRDMRYALRVLGRHATVTGTIVLTIGLGIGLNTAIFSVFSRVLLAPLPFPNAGQLYMVGSHAASLGDARRASSGPDFRDYRDQNTAFAAVAAVIPRFSEVWTGDGEPRVVNCAAPTLEFLEVMGIHPVVGRWYTPHEYQDLQHTTLLVSWNFWRSQLGGDPHVIGRTLRIEDVPSEIVGVMPPMPDIYSDVDIWMKLTTEPSWDYMNWRANKFLDVIGRLKPGITPNVAAQQLTAILRRGEGEPGDAQVQLTSLKEFVVGPVRTQLVIIVAAVSVVLLVTCLNAAALLSSRAVKRSSELALRLGLGASRGRIRQQLLVEGLLLSAMGGVFGIGLASFSMGLVQRVPGLTLPRLDNLRLDHWAVLASVVVVGFASVLFAVLPATVLSGLELSSSLRGGRTETGKRQRRPFAALVVAEVACAVVLTTSAGLLLRSFVRLERVDLGFDPSSVLTAYLRTNYYGAEGYPFWRNVLTQVREIPGATSAAVSDCMPAVRANAATLMFADRPNDPDGGPSAEACWISPDFFRTLGSSLLKGRALSDRDSETAPPVVVINAAAAQRFFPGANPLGKRIAVKYVGLGTANTTSRMREIVGIVSNVRQRAVELPPEPAIYLSFLQDESHHVLASMNLFVRGVGQNPGLLAPGVRSAIQSTYPNQPVERVAVLPSVVSRTLARRTYSVELMAAFAGLALLLCAIGIYGVVSYVTLQRTREFGIRMALGATRGDVLRHVLQRGASLVAIGTALGFAISLVVTRALSQLLFETTPLDPAIFASAVVLLALIGGLACLVPGVRASRLDPQIALNTE